VAKCGSSGEEECGWTQAAIAIGRLPGRADKIRGKSLSLAPGKTHKRLSALSLANFITTFLVGRGPERAASSSAGPVWASA